MKKISDYINNNYNLDYNTRAYEIEVTSFVSHHLCDNDIDKIKSIRENDPDIKKRFFAFFLLFTYYRRKYDKKTLNDLLSQSDEFTDFAILDHIKLLNDALEAKTTTQMYSLMLKTYELSENNLFKTHTGVLHHFCHAVINYFEETDSAYEEISKNDELTKYLDKAKEKIEICINSTEKYAKFYATKGRLALITKDYDDAIKSFRLAKVNEKMERADYGVIIGGYQDYILYAKQLKQAKDINEQQDKLEDSLKRMQASNFKIVSLFTAVITFVLGNLTLISNQEFPLELMFVYNGMFFSFVGVVILASTFIYLEDNLGKKNRRNKGLIALSIVLISIGIIMLIVFYLLEIL